MIRLIRRVLILCLAVTALFAQATALDLKSIAADPAAYAGRELSLNLRLKYFSEDFGVLVFYDGANRDIVFDVRELMPKKPFKRQLQNRHEGALYRVVFAVDGADSRGNVLGTLKTFTLLFIDDLP